MINRVKTALREALASLNQTSPDDDGLFHVSHLLYCPNKPHLRRQYPDLIAEPNLAILEGIRWEAWLHDVLEIGPEWAKYVDMTLTHCYNNRCLTGRPDMVFINHPARQAMLLEIKHTQYFRPSPDDMEALMGDYIITTTTLPSHYATQAGIYVNLLQHHLGNTYTVHGFIIALSNTVLDKRPHKIIAVQEIQGLTDDEILALFQKYDERMKNRRPAHAWECRYCDFKAVCEWRNKQEVNHEDV